VNPIVALEPTPGYSKRKERSTGLYHFAFLLRRRSDLAKVLIHLLKDGYPLQGASDHLFSEALYLADPEGNGIEIAYDRPPEDWKWTDGELPFVSEPLEVNHLLATDNGDEWRGFPDDTVLGHIHLHGDLPYRGDSAHQIPYTLRLEAGQQLFASPCWTEIQ